MELATIPFAWFFLATVTGAWLLRRQRRARNAFLLVASYYFCSRWRWMFLGAIVASSLVNYAAGEAIARARDPRRRSLVLAAAIAVDLAFLAFFKYWNFFADSIGGLAAWLGLGAHVPLLELVAPLGLSFYTFQQIAYLVDTARGTAARPGGVLDYLLFVAYFPKLAAGPIVRSHELLPQIMAPPPDAIPDGSRAIALILAGLFKKMVLGTYLATHMVEDAFLMPSNATTGELWIVLFAYTAQIYLDFSGYTDIARGCSLLLGFELPDNFRYPYAATNIGEYWRRWHISFSTWLRDYVYYPLGGSRRGDVRTSLNLILTFLVCGLWHGATWGFVLWGLVHGIALALHRLARRRHRVATFDARVVGWMATLTFCALARVFFKSEHLSDAWAFFRGLAGAPAPGLGVEWGLLPVTALAIAMNFLGEPCFRRFVRLHDRLPTPARPFVWLACALLLLTARPHDVALTIYFNF